MAPKVGDIIQTIASLTDFIRDVLRVFGRRANVAMSRQEKAEALRVADVSKRAGRQLLILGHSMETKLLRHDSNLEWGEIVRAVGEAVIRLKSLEKELNGDA